MAVPTSHESGLGTAALQVICLRCHCLPVGRSKAALKLVPFYAHLNACWDSIMKPINPHQFQHILFFTGAGMSAVLCAPAWSVSVTRMVHSLAVAR